MSVQMRLRNRYHKKLVLLETILKYFIKISSQSLVFEKHTQQVSSDAYLDDVWLVFVPFAMASLDMMSSPCCATGIGPAFGRCKLHIACIHLVFSPFAHM